MLYRNAGRVVRLGLACTWSRVSKNEKFPNHGVVFNEGHREIHNHHKLYHFNFNVTSINWQVNFLL